MTLTRDEVRKVAALAQLHLGEEEEEALAEALSAVVDYIARLDEVDTRGVEPLAHVHAAQGPVREDALAPSLPREVALANAPRQEEGAYQVPLIIGEAP